MVLKKTLTKMLIKVLTKKLTRGLTFMAVLHTFQQLIVLPTSPRHGPGHGSRNPPAMLTRLTMTPMMTLMAMLTTLTMTPMMTLMTMSAKLT
jgi:hypothetical protein